MTCKEAKACTNMKVPASNATNGSNSANVSALHNRGAASAAGGSAGLPAGGLQRDDEVQVSTLSHRLSALALQPPGQASRLMELSSVVSAGRYQVDPQVLSNKLIQEHMRTAA